MMGKLTHNAVDNNALNNLYQTNDHRDSHLPQLSVVVFYTVVR